MIDVVHEINAGRRKVGSRVLEPGEARTVTITRSYRGSVDDVWDACTNPERIPRWFLPVSGDLEVGGRFQIEGNASGTIETCDPPRSFTATWENRGDVSWIELRLAPEGDETTRFELEHIALPTDHWKQFGPGAVGIGWDLALLGLLLHLDSGAAVDPAEFEKWSTSDDGLQFMSRSNAAWCEADIEAGAEPEQARAAAAQTLAFYTGAEPPAA